LQEGALAARGKLAAVVGGEGGAVRRGGPTGATRSGHSGKVVTVVGGEDGRGVPSGASAQGHTGQLTAVGRAGAPGATLQDATGLVQPLASAFSDALNESKREHAAVVEHTKHPARSAPPADGALSGHPGGALARPRRVEHPRAHAASAPHTKPALARATPAKPIVISHAARGAHPLQEQERTPRVTGLHLLSSRLSGVWSSVWGLGGNSGGATDK